MEKQPRIEHVFFDMAEVLIQGLLNIGSFLAGELNVPAETVLPGLRLHLGEYMMDQMNENEFWRRVLHDNNWTGNVEVLKAIVRKHLEPSIPGTEHVVRKVAETCPIYLHSDISREWMNYVLRHHRYMRNLFRRMFYSFELRALKKNLGTFARTTQAIAARPESCLLIDDYHGNLSSAQTIGMQTIQFKDADQCAQDLIRLGVIR